MAWEVFLIGTLTGVLLIGVVAAIGRLLRELALRDQQARRRNSPSLPLVRRTATASLK